MDTQKIGGWAFIVGILLAVVAVFVQLDVTMLTGGLVLLGLVVGFLNVSGHESKEFLLASVSLVIVSGLGGGVNSGLAAVPTIGPYMVGMLGNIMTFLIPAVVVVALKTVHGLAKD
jgi:ATP synthase protein I